MMDQDAVRADGKLNTAKERVLAEIGEDQCWVTQGREVENYLLPELVKRYLTAEVGQPVMIKFNRSGRVDRAILAATKGLDGPTIDYARAKVKYARAICELMSGADLDALDLRERMEGVVALIRKWNHMDADETPTPG